jgi:hypothetical protein
MLTNTDATGGLGLSVDQCYLPAGWGSSMNSAGKLVAKACVKGRYGASEDIYGISPRPCQVCKGAGQGAKPACAQHRVSHKLYMLQQCLHVLTIAQYVACV